LLLKDLKILTVFYNWTQASKRMPTTEMS
jgi:hypothetical protein